MNETFNLDYAKFYDSLYNKKDYQDESNKIITLIDKYSSKKLENIKILDYGCGTGNHLFYFKRYTKNLFGYDKSKSMIKIAKQKDINKSISFHSSKKSIFNKEIKFDVVVMLFDVFSYLNNNDDINKELKFIKSIMKKNGLFIFQFWYGPSVMHTKPKSYNKKIIMNKNIITKKCISNLSLNLNLVNIKYKFLDKNKKNLFSENHTIRYFFKDEINLFLEYNHFKQLSLTYLDRISSKIKVTNQYSVTCVGKSI